MNMAYSRSGCLFIIGGGYRPKYMMDEFIRLAGGSDARIVIIPSASSFPVETAMAMKKEFNSLGCYNIDYTDYNPDDSDEMPELEKLASADAIFFTGGDQNKLVHKYYNTRLLQEIRNRYAKGALIGGTSAGAAIMSRIMLTSYGPDDLEENVSPEIETGRAVLARGFGFLEDYIIDQHFNTRPRRQRLINAVLKNPDKIGIGIDESTALIVRPNGSFNITGENTVTLFSNILHTGSGDFSSTAGFYTDKLYPENISVSTLKPGKNKRFYLNCYGFYCGDGAAACRLNGHSSGPNGHSSNDGKYISADLPKEELM